MGPVAATVAVPPLSEELPPSSTRSPPGTVLPQAEEEVQAGDECQELERINASAWPGVSFIHLADVSCDPIEDLAVGLRPCITAGEHHSFEPTGPAAAIGSVDLEEQCFWTGGGVDGDGLYGLLGETEGDQSGDEIDEVHPDDVVASVEAEAAMMQRAALIAAQQPAAAWIGTFEEN